MIRILADAEQKAAIIEKGTGNFLVSWVNDVDELVAVEAEAYLDLLFQYSKERIAKLSLVLPKLVLINSVVHRLSEIQAPFVRVNAWPGFLQRPLLEAAAAVPQRKLVETFSGLLNWNFTLLPDEPGFVAARVIAMIVNEAYLALQEDVGTRAGIDLAMKTGTNYPLGPFEWGEKIGLANIEALLRKLSADDQRYEPAALLLKEIQG